METWKLTICKMKEQQTPRDKVLWILGSANGQMSIIRRCQRAGLKKAELDIILEGLKRENRTYYAIKHATKAILNFK